MASPVDEKNLGAGLVITTTSKELNPKASHETFATEMPSPATEKITSRTSDVSVPTTARLNPFDTDIEAMITSTETSHRRSMECTKGGTDCHAWPGREHWQAKAKKAKAQRRNWHCLGNLTKRNRLIAKLLIGLLIIGIAVGVGVGISKPLGSGIWTARS